MDNKEFAKHISECLGFDVTDKAEFLDNCSGVGCYYSKENLKECKSKAFSLNVLSKAFGWGVTFEVRKTKNEKLINHNYYYMLLASDEWDSSTEKVA